MKKLIEVKRSIIVAADVEAKDDFYDEIVSLVKQTCSVPGIGGYKIGFKLATSFALDEVVNTIRWSAKPFDLPIIYDHQKAGTDIPELGRDFAKVCKIGRVDAVILFPFGGATTERKWIKACQDVGLVVLVGGHMTQPEFLWSEGGFVADEAPERIYRIAIDCGVRNFVVPGNKVEYVKKYRQLFEQELGEGNFVLYAPGFIAQGGVITETGKAAGDNWHAIVGSAIYKAKDMTAAAKEITSQIVQQKINGWTF